MIDKALQMIYANLDRIKWHNSNEPSLKWYYAENGLYVIFDTVNRSIAFEKASNPDMAIMKYVMDALHREMGDG